MRRVFSFIMSNADLFLFIKICSFFFSYDQSCFVPTLSVSWSHVSWSWQRPGPRVFPLFLVFLPFSLPRGIYHEASLSFLCISWINKTSKYKRGVWCVVWLIFCTKWTDHVLPTSVRGDSCYVMKVGMERQIITAKGSTVAANSTREECWQKTANRVNS